MPSNNKPAAAALPTSISHPLSRQRHKGSSSRSPIALALLLFGILFNISWVSLNKPSDYNGSNYSGPARNLSDLETDTAAAPRSMSTVSSSITTLNDPPGRDRLHGGTFRNSITDIKHRYPIMVHVAAVDHIPLQDMVYPISASPYKADGESGYENPIPLLSEEEKLAEWNDEDECVLEEWQIRARPSCNSMHEVGLEGGAKGGTQIKVLGWGGSRTTYMVHSAGTPVALKGPHYRHDDVYYYEKQLKDAIILERASSSPYIPDIYGFCGLNVLMEFSQGGNIFDYLRGSRYNGGKNNATLNHLDRLKVGVQIAGGVAAMHEIAGLDKPPAFAHNDVCCHQYLFFNGVFKLNDFDHSKVIRINKDTGELCRMESGMKIFKMRAPEEMRAKAASKGKIDGDGVPSKFATDKVDVYLMANVMYYVLTNKFLFEGMSRKDAVDLLIKGERSPLLWAETSSDPGVKALVTAIKMCWEDDPDKRPGSREVADYLEGELEKVDEEFKRTKVNRITLPERGENMLGEYDWHEHN